MRIIDNARPDRQIVLFSATFPRQMEALARRLLVRPIEIQVGGRSVVGKDINQTVHVTEDDDQKYLKLLELLGLYSEKVIRFALFEIYAYFVLNWHSCFICMVLLQRVSVSSQDMRIHIVEYPL